MEASVLLRPIQVTYKTIKDCRVKMKSEMFNKVVFLTFLSQVSQGLAVRTLEYQHYRLESMCGLYQDKQTIFLKSQPAVISLTSRNSKQIKCHLELRLSSDYFGFSVFTEFMRLDNNTGCSRDFLQFGRDFIIFTSFKSAKRCGTLEPTQRVLRDDGSLLEINYGDSPVQQREYIEAEDDEMDIWLEINPPGPHQPNKQLKLIVTPFKKVCSKSDYLYKQCPSNNKCIKRELFCDGVINCDGEEKDEKEEYCLKSSILPGSAIFMSIPVIIIVVIVSLVVLMAIILVCKMTISYCKPRIIQGTTTTRGTVEPSQTISPRGSVLARGTVSPRETVPARGTITPRGTVTPRCTVTPRNITDYNTRPSAPAMSMGEEGPYMSPLPPTYNEVMGIGYKEEPPKYSEFPER